MDILCLCSSKKEEAANVTTAEPTTTEAPATETTTADTTTETPATETTAENTESQPKDKKDSVLDKIKNKIENNEAITTEDFDKVFENNLSPN